MNAPASMYESAARIQARSVHGRFARLRVASMVALLGIFYCAPWITIAGAPAIWFDLPRRQFHLLGLHLVPQDLYLLSWLLMIAATGLFLFTSLAGRLWCGYACPQTVWTEAFMWIERAIEGDRHARMKLDASPWTPRKIALRSARHASWAALGLFTGLTFVAYFVPARELFPAALHLQLAGWPLFWSLFYGFATWGNAGFMREQVCKHMCPYARFQSAMFDRDTLIIAYDEKRGEPRKSLAKKLGAPAASCVDCSMCVQVCPAGIDIRKGLQYECIACAACVDVCDEVMDNVGQPRGLIRYTTLARDAGGKTRVLRGRTIAYGLVWLALVAGFCAALFLRQPFEFDVMRDRHSLYRELADDSIENVYLVKLGNKDNRAHEFALLAQAPSGEALRVKPDRVTLQAAQSVSLTVSVRSAPRGEAREHDKHPASIRLVAQDTSDPRITRSRETRFFGE